MSVNISTSNWGTFGGSEVYLFKLQNTSGAYVELTNYGAGIVSVVVPDKSGELEHVVLGFNELEGYLDDQCYLGSSIGRFANRISNARFSLNGQEYNLEANDMGNSNHSGSSGCHAKVFDFITQGNTVIFSLTLPDGEGGFPGNLNLNISYEWTEENQLKINYQAMCDKDTVANFTNHAYFNLSGEKEDILNHTLSLNAGQLLEANEQYIPTGKIIDSPKWLFPGNKIADKLNEAEVFGFNEYYILNSTGMGIPAAVLKHRESGRQLSVYTTYPGLMFYTGDYLTSTYPGKTLKHYKGFDGLCLECQFYPDAPNQPSFPTAVLKRGAHYNEQIIYQFSTLTDAD